MRTIDIGVLRAEQIKFAFIGDYLLNDTPVPSQNIVAVEGGMLCFNGKHYKNLCFKPQTPDCSFVLYDVVIGVGFHWQRKENQVFKGELSLIVEDGEVRAINRIAVEEYLVSVISSEMSATSSLEFLKAHAIVSRSWLYAQLFRKEKVQQGTLGWATDDEIVRWYAREDHTLFDLCADDHCQRYQGITRAQNPNVARAVGETAGQVLKYDGEVCDARFSKCCGGATEYFSSCWEDENPGYLQAFRDCAAGEELPLLSDEAAARRWIESEPSSFCATSDKAVLSQILNGYDRETNDFYRWRVEYEQKDLSDIVASRSGIDFGMIEELVPLERGASGRITRLRVVGSKASRIVGKELEIRRWLSKTHLYSSAFVVDRVCCDDKVKFIIKGAGWGHGVGLCQVGAAVMGESGASHTQILAHYYPGAIVDAV